MWYNYNGPAGPFNMKSIYLDNAAATPIDARVTKAMTAAQQRFANPSAFNYLGRLMRQDIESARSIVGQFLNARADEITFTSSGSEANNLALSVIKKGVVITTPIEHPSVLEPLKKNKSLKVKYVPVGSDGIVDLTGFQNMLFKDCGLVSIMYANNEIGSIQPIQRISKIIRQFNSKNKTNILFHVDACQAAGFLDMNVQHLGADLITFNGSKIYGPRGIGVLYTRRGIKLNPITLGGSQEHGARAGTENFPAIIGLVQALLLIDSKKAKSIATVRDYMIHQVEKQIPQALLTGPAAGENRIANSVSVCICDLESENLLLELDKYGIAAGSGSACTSHSVEPSHVLTAVGIPKSFINGAVRFSLGRDTTKKDVEHVVKTLGKVVSTLQKRYARLR